MSTKSKTSWSHWLVVAIGLGFMLGFPRLAPIEPITPVGMTILGVFIGMVFLWSASDSIWPSLLGLLIVSLSGFVPNLKGYLAVKAVFLNAFGNETVVVVILGLVFFAGLEYVGCTKYMARFFLSIKALEGRPYVFLFLFFFASYFIGGLANPMASMLLLWPIAIEICAKFGYKKDDKIFYTMIAGVYFASTLGQPMFPFKGASYIVISAFEKMSKLHVNYGAYILYNVIMSMIILLCFIAFIKFVVRPDVEGFKKVTVAELNTEKLPKMNIQQIMYFLTALIYIVALIIPNFLPKTIPWVGFLSRIGIIGVTILCIVTLMILRFEGKSMFDFRGIAKKSFSWDIFFLVAAALYVCNAMTAESTGIKPFLLQFLQPILGGRSEIAFIAILLAFALITTNFANNAGMALILLPIVITFADQYQGVQLMPLYMTIAMMVFVAILTPAASPYCGMLHAQRDLISFKQITMLFVPMFFVAYFVYVFVGYRIATILFQ